MNTMKWLNVVSYISLGLLIIMIIIVCIEIPFSFVIQYIFEHPIFIVIILFIISCLVWCGLVVMDMLNRISQIGKW